MTVLRTILSDMHVAQVRTAGLCSMGLNARRSKQPFSPRTWAEWTHALDTQSREIARCASMLAGRFTAANDEPETGRAA